MTSSVTSAPRPSWYVLLSPQVKTEHASIVSVVA